MISSNIVYQVTSELGCTGKPVEIIIDSNGMVTIKANYLYSINEFDNIVRQLNEVVKMMNGGK
jgi:hypothetical protein